MSDELKAQIVRAAVAVSAEQDLELVPAIIRGTLQDMSKAPTREGRMWARIPRNLLARVERVFARQESALAQERAAKVAAEARITILNGLLENAGRLVTMWADKAIAEGIKNQETAKLFDPMNNPDLRIPVTMTEKQIAELRDRLDEELSLGGDASTLVVQVRDFLAGGE